MIERSTFAMQECFFLSVLPSLRLRDECAFPLGLLTTIQINGFLKVTADTIHKAQAFRPSFAEDGSESALFCIAEKREPACEDDFRGFDRLFLCRYLHIVSRHSYGSRQEGARKGGRCPENYPRLKARYPLGQPFVRSISAPAAVFQMAAIDWGYNRDATFPQL